MPVYVISGSSAQKVSSPNDVDELLGVEKTEQNPQAQPEQNPQPEPVSESTNFLVNKIKEMINEELNRKKYNQ